MVTIKKGKIKIEVPNDSFLSLQDTSEGMYFKFKDNTEIRFEVPVTPQIKAVSSMIMKSTAPNILLDFDSKNLISFSGDMTAAAPAKSAQAKPVQAPAKPAIGSVQAPAKPAPEVGKA